MGYQFGLVGGPEKREIRLVPYQGGWPDRFRLERAQIVRALGAAARRVDHIGSTSVPGLMAKPIVDIDLSVADADDEAAYLPAMNAPGTTCGSGNRGTGWCAPPPGVHVHICAAGGAWERRHLLFRDWLRHDPVDRDRYQRVKQDLTRRDWPSMNDYAAAKSPIINDITRHAERWALETSWTVDRSTP